VIGAVGWEGQLRWSADLEAAFEHAIATGAVRPKLRHQ
jgi:hypothetical protein